MRLPALRTAALLSIALAGAARAQDLTTVRVTSGLTLPLFVGHAPGEFNRIFILEQRSGTTGRVRVFDLTTRTLLATPFLSVPNVTTGNEQGLLGIAFHPDYQNNGRFFIDYTTTGGGAAGKIVVAEYKATPPSSNVAVATAVQTILQINDPESNHNGGWIDFGPDGYLYIAVGDGGGANDQHGSIGNGQLLTTNLGKMLRVDVNGDDFPADTTRNYRIPPSNPFFGSTSANPEIWAYGLRNPWRDSFDRLTGDLWIADVGQNAVEEINFQPAGAAGARNYGWRCMEGTTCTGLSGCTCNAPALTMPIYTYTHASGNCSITGGYVYRGPIPGLGGTYFFADYCSNQIQSFRYDAVNGLTEYMNRTTQLAPGGGLSITSVTSFGEDGEGNLYIVDQNGGEIFRLACRSDVDTNGYVNGDDFDTFVAWFIAGDPRADYNRDTFVSGDDFDLFAADFVAGC